MKLTFEDLMNDPSLFEQIERQARRERAKAVHNLLIAPVADYLSGHAHHPQAASQGSCG